MSKNIKPLRWLLYLALVTSVIASTTMARYASQNTIAGEARIAAFVTSETVSFDTYMENLVPGDMKTVNFNVCNYQGDAQSEVALEYSIEITATENLPLTFSLHGEKAAEDTDEGSVVVSDLTGLGIAEGGKLPVGEKTAHSYTLTVAWQGDQTDVDYSNEIDMVTVNITTEQAALS